MNKFDRLSRLVPRLWLFGVVVRVFPFFLSFDEFVDKFRSVVTGELLRTPHVRDIVLQCSREALS